jgi:TolB protein
VLYAKQVDGISQIFVTDTLFENSIQLTHNNYHSWRPRVNAQKTRIAFLSTRDINPQLYTMNMDGTNVVKVTRITTGGYYNKGVGFSWLPDGDHLVFSSYNQLYTVYHDGSGRRLVTTLGGDKHFREVDWSPAGDKIVALALGIDYYDAEILLMNSDGSGREVLVDSLPGALADPVFSIDGNNILYTYDESEYQINKRRQLDARIFRYDLKTGETTDLSSGKEPGTNDLIPLYTQNGGHVTFINTSNSIGARKDLWLLQPGEAEATNRRLLVKGVEAGDWANK